MFSKYLKIIFVTTAYSPVLLVCWFVSYYNTIKANQKVVFVNFSNFRLSDLFNRLNLIYLFFLLALICWLLLYLATNKLTRNTIKLKSIKSADFNMIALIFTYFLPCIELLNKDKVYVFGWIAFLIVIILINKGTYFYNPLMKLFGYRYYEIATKEEVTYTMLSKEKLINGNNVNAYSQLTDYVILNASNK